MGGVAKACCCMCIINRLNNDIMKTRLLSLFVALLATTALWSYDLKFGNLYYNILTDSTVEVVRDDSYASLTTVTIPSTFSQRHGLYSNRDKILGFQGMCKTYLRYYSGQRNVYRRFCFRQLHESYFCYYSEQRNVYRRFCFRRLQQSCHYHYTQ